MISLCFFKRHIIRLRAHKHFFRSMDNVLVLAELWVGRRERSLTFHCVPSILLNFHNKIYLVKDKFKFQLSF